MNNYISYRLNVMKINSEDSFLNFSGNLRNGQRDVIFARSLGISSGMKEKIESIDRKMTQQMNNGRLVYIRITSLDSQMTASDTAYYSQIYEKWKISSSIELRNKNNNSVFGNTLANATNEAVRQYKLIKPSVTDTMLKNYIIKLWYRTDTFLKECISKWNENLCTKVIASGICKEQDYLFMYMASLIGCDVLLLQTKEDISDKLKNLSCAFTVGNFGDIEFKKYDRNSFTAPAAPPVVSNPVVNNPPKIIVPQHPARKSAPAVNNSENIREKSYEELAALAASVVMIQVINASGEPIASGSGIMIGREGYILTNCHVLTDGRVFAVRIENDDKTYLTNEIIKYNNSTDLAIIRIQRNLVPIKVYSMSKELVRGQKVIAIGSPLGLFNSVSDGIISGFRKIKDMDMIQFTAPISSGSSGGAVLNTYGQLIGISTAGIDKGQNINLAVSYKSINLFARGFF